MNREADLILEAEEQAGHLFGGGVLHSGYARGMLWGAVLAAGACAVKTFHEPDIACAASLSASQDLMDAFKTGYNFVDCHDLTGCEFSKATGVIKYILLGRFKKCINIAVEWAGKADQIIASSINRFDPNSVRQPALNCAALTIKHLAEVIPGIEEKDSILCAGFAGGIGLKGNVCGALACAIFALTLMFYRKEKKQRDSRLQSMIMGLGLSYITKTVSGFIYTFRDQHESMLCSKLCGNSFSTIDEHAEFMEQGGCHKLIEEIVTHVQKVLSGYTGKC